ncbi:hypothetical protein AB0D11_46210 [Streptomyces monashensis]|uniref:hypothetical protein n=1 Tax=Streptomyces monashensis TaxID=1678012 RepID=UPI0033F399D1
MTPPEHSPTPAEVWPGWTPSQAAQDAYGRHLPDAARAIHTALFARSYDWAKAVEAWQHSPATQPDVFIASHLDQRDDILEAAAALDLIALCHGPGTYDDSPTQQGITDPAAEVRSDAATLALLLVAHDRQQPEASRTGLPGITTGHGPADDQTKDSARAYVRAEWAARQER